MFLVLFWFEKMVLRVIVVSLSRNDPVFLLKVFRGRVRMFEEAPFGYNLKSPETCQFLRLQFSSFRLRVGPFLERNILV